MKYCSILWKKLQDKMANFSFFFLSLAGLTYNHVCCESAGNKEENKGFCLITSVFSLQKQQCWTARGRWQARKKGGVQSHLPRRFSRQLLLFCYYCLSEHKEEVIGRFCETESIRYLRRAE